MTSNTAPYIKVRNIDKYIQAIKDRYNSYFIIKGDGSYVYLCNGIEVPGNEFEANNPIPELQKNVTHKGFSLDGRTNWIE